MALSAGLKSLPKEINYTLHPRHPLKLMKRYSEYHSPDDKHCLFCEEECHVGAYHCSICGFTVCEFCLVSPPEVAIDLPEIHEHTLTLMPREISFTCDACGEVRHCSPYVCLQCNFMIHIKCLDLPRVIKISRHEHRISLTYFLGPGDWVCGVCRGKVHQNYGSYSCSVCSYAVHTKCATIKDVWNEEELEGKPEIPCKEVKPFEMIEEGVIKHFSHDHYLRLNKHCSTRDEHKLCEACVLPILSNPFYSCMECSFILHEVCATLPLEKQHPLFPQPLSLQTNGDKDFRSLFRCYICGRRCSGFKYTSSHPNIKIDVGCSSLSEPFNLEGHPHPLFFIPKEKRCSFCYRDRTYVLSCIECEGFHMCCKCATLPRTVSHKYDDRPAILHFVHHLSHSCWCEICEEELILDWKGMWLYACDECGFTSHVDCLLGRDPLVKLGHRLEYEGYKCEAIENNGPSRPICRECKRRCLFPMILKSTEDADTYFCSLGGLSCYLYNLRIR